MTQSAFYAPFRRLVLVNIYNAFAATIASRAEPPNHSRRARPAAYLGSGKFERGEPVRTAPQNQMDRRSRLASPQFAAYSIDITPSFIAIPIYRFASRDE